MAVIAQARGAWGSNPERSTHCAHASCGFTVSRIVMLKGPRRFGCTGEQCASDRYGKGTLMRHFL
jgi:hypothetical protein